MPRKPLASDPTPQERERSVRGAREKRKGRGRERREENREYAGRKELPHVLVAH